MHLDVNSLHRYCGRYLSPPVPNVGNFVYNCETASEGSGNANVSRV